FSGSGGRELPPWSFALVRPEISRKELLHHRRPAHKHGHRYSSSGFGSDDQKFLAVVADVVVTIAIRSCAVNREWSLKKGRGPAGFERAIGLQRDRHQLSVQSQVIELPAVVPPFGLDAAFGADLQFCTVRIGERLHNDLKCAGLICRIGDPVCVRRNPRLNFVKWCFEKGPWFSISEQGKKPGVVVVVLCPRKDDVLIVRRPGGGNGNPAVSLHQLLSPNAAG